MKGVNGKRVYLIEREVDNAPALLRPFLRFRWVLKLWRRFCFYKVRKMPEGKVLSRYYELTGGANERVDYR